MTGGIGPAIVTPEEEAAYLWGEEVVKQRLPNTRALAKEWGATVTALTGLLGTGTIIGSDDIVRSLISPYAVIYGVTALLAFACAGGAILCSALAAQAKVGDIPPGAEERLALLNDRVNYALKRLRCSKILAGAALVLLAVSFALRWYGPTASEDAAESAPTATAHTPK